MAERVASIKLSLKSQGARTGLRDLRSDAERNAKGMGDAFRRHMSAGLKGGLDSIKGSFSGLKTFVTGLGLFAGLPGLKDQVQQAVRMEARYRQLAFAIKAGTGVGVQWRDVQKDIQRAALETGNKTEDLAASFQGLFTDVGDPEFAAAAMKSVAFAAAASGTSVQTLSEIAGTLNEKFGVTADQMDEALRGVLSLGNKGGVSVEQMAEKLGIVGASAKAAGLDGVAGFSKVAALLNLADGPIGNLKKSIAAVSGVIDTLGNQAARSKVLLKLGLDPTTVNGDATDVIGRILEKTGGRKEALAAAGFQDDQLKLLVDLGHTYAKVFAKTEGDVKTKAAAALEAYRATLDAAGKATLTEAAMKEQFADEMQSTERQIQQSLTRLEQAFADPRVTAAIGKVAAALPPLVESITSAASFAVDNPATAALGVGGAIALKGFAVGAIESAIVGGFARGSADASREIAGGLAGAAGPAGSALGLAFKGIAIAGLAVAVGAALRETYERHKKEVNQKELDELDRAGTGELQKGDEFLTYSRDPKTGEFITKRSKVRTAQDRLKNAVGLARDAAQRELGASLPTPDAGGPNWSEDPTAFYRDAAAPTGSPAAGTSAGPGRTGPGTVQIQNEVRVRVVNAHDIGASAPPNVTPGWWPR